jgi:hypothetical protein
VLQTPYPKGGDECVDGTPDSDMENPHLNASASQFALPEQYEYYRLAAEVVHGDTK